MFRLGIRLDFAEVLEPPSRVQIVIQAYQYSLLDRNDTELLVYHWHPQATGPNVPHLHVSAALDAQVDARSRQTIDLDKRHLATGLVTLRSVVRMLITEFQIRPLHADWAERLADPEPH